MKALILPLATLGALAVLGSAEAAPPAYCALYAREYANQFSSAIGKPDGSESRIQDEAYYRCLNQDENPEMPMTSAYSGTDVESPGGVGGPLEEITGEGDASPPDEAVTTEEAKAAPDVPPEPKAEPDPPKNKVAETRRGYTSGAEAGSPEWRAWCKKNFPNSFDEKTGTIVPYGGKRQLCK
jgi:hypothetical protein